jgi:aldehyde:ferredoxin oxidoreductase
MGKAIHINLTTRKIRSFSLKKSLLKKYLGGRGLSSYFLFKNIPERVDPFSSENIIIFSAGPLAGTRWPTGSRVTVAAKSPLTGGLGYAHAGGDFGPELKFAGYDLLIVSGKARSPSYLCVEDGRGYIRDASHIWKSPTSEAIKAIQEDVSKCRVACIGPAGTNLVRISSIITDKERAAARCGLGSVMGSKNLKAVGVKGTEKMNVANADEFRELCAEASKRSSPKNPQVQGLSEKGTPWLVTPKNNSGDLPAKNHQTAQFPWADKISGETLRERYFIKIESCFSCPIHCRAFSKVTEGKYAPITGPRPEYESIDALGPMCWISDFSAIMKANQMCNELGLDTISTGVSIAFAMELYEKGIITEKETGLSLEWGDDESVLSLIGMMARREGFGDILAEGVARAAVRIGGEAGKYAMHVKGMELPRQEPRTVKGFALGHAVSNRGADHLYALPTIDNAARADIAQQLFEKLPTEQLLDTQCPTYKPEMIIFTEHYCAVSDALGVCKFTTTESYLFMPSDFSKALSALTGENFTKNALLTCGERIVNLERCFNLREGFSRKDDSLPERFLKEPYQGSVVELDEMLSKYYRLRKWSQNGAPRKETLKKLGLYRLCKQTIEQ